MVVSFVWLNVWWHLLKCVGLYGCLFLYKLECMVLSLSYGGECLVDSSLLCRNVCVFLFCM